MQDIHCHVIYGVDDGSESVQESINMLKAAKEAGIDRICATPHIKSKDAPIEPIYERFAQLHSAAKKLEIDLRLGFEYNVRAIDFEHLERSKDYTLAGTDILLLEMPFSHWSSLWENVIYSLQAMKLKIIIAHPERYDPIQKNLSIIDAMADMGCFFQCNASSVIGGKFERLRVIRYLKKSGRIDFVATDAHSISEYNAYQKAIRRLKNSINYQSLDEISECNRVF